MPVSPVIRMVERLGATWPDQIEQAHHALALADDVGEAVALLEGALEVGVLVFEKAPRDHAVDLDQQLLVVPGLGEIIVGAEFEGVDRGFDGAVGRDHEDRRFLVARAHLLEHVHAGHVGHHEIEQHQVVGSRIEFLQALAAVVGEFDEVAAFQGQKVVQTFADIQFIVDDQDLALGAGGGIRGIVH